MATSHLIFLSVPGLRPADIDQAATPTLFGWAGGGAIGEMAPTFPCVTSSVQASMFTRVGPDRHGIIANGFYYRDRHEVEMWTGWNNLIEAPQIWEALRSNGMTSAVWHAQNIKGAAADLIVTPAPIHEPDGTTKLWCYSKPDGLYPQLLDAIGHFPLQHYWGPLANIESTRWILRAACWLIEKHAPNFHWIYVPHLDYAMQKYGPNSPQAQAALTDLDHELGGFAERVARSRVGKDVVFFVAGEYAMTDVRGAVFPNRILREAGLLQIEERNGAEYLDFQRSDAFAMVDHQLAHVYINPHVKAADMARIFEKTPGIAAAYAGDQRARVGMTHARCGDVVLVSEEDRWLAYYWWLDDAKAPPFARTVDIHRKPGYDPVELFFDPRTRSIPLEASLVKGSHGVPAVAAHHRTAVICTRPMARLAQPQPIHDTDLFDLVAPLLC